MGSELADDTSSVVIVIISRRLGTGWLGVASLVVGGSLRGSESLRLTGTLWLDVWYLLVKTESVDRHPSCI